MMRLEHERDTTRGMTMARDAVLRAGGLTVEYTFSRRDDRRSLHIFWD